MRSSTTMSASQLMPNTMDRLKRFLPTKQVAASQDPFARIQERAGFAQDVLRKSVTTIVQNLHQRQADDEQEMMDLFLMQFAMQQNMDVEMLKAQLMAEAMRAKGQQDEGGGGGGIAKMVAGWIVRKVLFGLAKTAIVNFMRVLIRYVLRAGISFIFRTIIRYVAIGIAGAIGSVISAIGLPVILGGLAIGGAGFAIYKKFFDDTPNEESSAPSADAQQPGSLWKNILRKFLGLKEDTADVINTAVAAGKATPIATSQATVPITEEMKKKGLALLKYRTPDIASVIANAAKVVGESEPILNAFAAVESRFDPNAGASTSSAKGLFQFVTGTWRYTVGKYGKRYGVSGDASVFDANANALMGAAYLKHEIRPAIERVVSNPNATDLYFGHLLGPGGGPRFLKGYYSSPNDLATKHVSDNQVNANKPVFFHDKGKGRAKTLAEVYMNFAAKFSPIESYIKSPEQFGQSSTLSVPAVAVGSLDTKTASYEPPKVDSKENDLFNAMNKAQDKEAGSLATAPKDKDYVRGRKGKIVQVG